MKIVLKQAWKQWGVGHVFTDMPPNQASELIRRGIAEEAVDGKPRTRRARGTGMQAGLDYETR